MLEAVERRSLRRRNAIIGGVAGVATLFGGAFIVSTQGGDAEPTPSVAGEESGGADEGLAEHSEPTNETSKAPQSDAEEAQPSTPEGIPESDVWSPEDIAELEPIYLTANTPQGLVDQLTNNFLCNLDHPDPGTRNECGRRIDYGFRPGPGHTTYGDSTLYGIIEEHRDFLGDPDAPITFNMEIVTLPDGIQNPEDTISGLSWEFEMITVESLAVDSQYVWKNALTKLRFVLREEVIEKESSPTDLRGETEYVRVWQLVGSEVRGEMPQDTEGPTSPNG